MYCVYYQRCILPCRFQGGDEVVIQYVYLKNIPVHSFYQNQDQTSFQDLQFSNRTSLFKEEISKGNASLLLREVKVDDEGEYTCSVSTITGKESSIISLRVDGERITTTPPEIHKNFDGFVF